MPAGQDGSALQASGAAATGSTPAAAPRLASHLGALNALLLVAEVAQLAGHGQTHVPAARPSAAPRSAAAKVAPPAGPPAATSGQPQAAPSKRSRTGGPADGRVAPRQQQQQHQQQVRRPTAWQQPPQRAFGLQAPNLPTDSAPNLPTESSLRLPTPRMPTEDGLSSMVLALADGRAGETQQPDAVAAATTILRPFAAHQGSQADGVQQRMADALLLSHLAPEDAAMLHQARTFLAGFPLPGSK